MLLPSALGFVAYLLAHFSNDRLATGSSAEQILAFRPSAALQSRASQLLEFNRQRRLTDAEQAELGESGRINHFGSMLKIRAQQKLDAR
jgi:hypothetical protein